MKAKDDSQEWSRFISHVFLISCVSYSARAKSYAVQFRVTVQPGFSVAMAPTYVSVRRNSSSKQSLFTAEILASRNTIAEQSVTI